MSDGAGLRARKKEATRRVIAEAARRLFTARGFEAVTVAEVAREADVSEGTVFNYFPTKEDLFFSGMEDFGRRLVDAVRARPRGEPAIAAVRRAVVEGAGRLGDKRAAQAIAGAAAVIGSSPALQRGEREVLARSADALAALLANEAGGPESDVEVRVVANCLMAAHHAVVVRVRAEASAGRRGADLVAIGRLEAGRAFGVLERGLGDVAACP